MYLQIAGEEKGWEAFERFEFQVLGRTTHPKKGMPFILTIMCPDKDTGASLEVKVEKPDTWVPVSVPIKSIADLGRLGSLLFYIGEKHYDHGEHAEFFIGGFRLVGGTARPHAPAVTFTKLDPDLLDDMDRVKGWNVLKDAKTRPADSKAQGRGAMHVDFPGRVRKKLRRRPLTQRLSWNDYEGISFQVKGDGSDSWGCLAIQGWAGRLSYVHYFPLASAQWHQVTVPWHRFSPQGQFLPIGVPGGLPPSGIDTIELGDRWTWGADNEALAPYAYDIDEIRLAPKAGKAPPPRKPRPIDQVLKLLRTRRPVVIACAGDSITAGAALADPAAQRYPAQLQKMLRQRLGNETVTVRGLGVGGARSTDGRAWVERDLARKAPDLVTILYGYNDKKNSTASYFGHSIEDYVDRIARVTKGRTAVLLLTTIPGKDAAYFIVDDMAEAVRDVAARRGLAMVDLNRIFKETAGPAQISAYFADMAHPNEKGQALIARSIADFLLGDDSARAPAVAPTLRVTKTAATTRIRAHRIVKTDKPPVIDGRLDEAIWTRALRFETFKALEGGEQESPPTTALLAYDEDHLYVAYWCAEPHMERLSASETSHDGPVWRDDCAEIFLNPSGDRHLYYQVVVNAAGVMRDGAYDGGPYAQDLDWESGTEVATTRGDDHWTMELRLPIDSLSLPASGEPWTFQLGRTRCPVPQHMTMLGSPMKLYHNPALFDRLEGFAFEDRHVGFVGASLGELYEGRNIARVELRNPGSVPQDVRVTVDLEGEGEVGALETRVPGERESVLEVPWRLSRVTERVVRLDVQCGGRRVGGVQRRIAAVPPLLGRPLRRTFIRNGERRLNVDVPVHLAEGSRGENVTLNWLLRHRDGDEVDRGRTRVVSDRVKVQCRPPEPGRYTLDLELELSRQSRTTAREPLWLTRGPFMSKEGG